MIKDQTSEQTIYSRFIGRYCALTKVVGGTQLYYRGTILQVLADKIILDDRKLGEIPLSFEGLSIIAVEGDRHE